MSAPALKAAIRTEVLLRRAEVSVGTRRAFAERLAHEGVALARRGVGRATPVASVFLSIRGEPDTEPLIEALVAAGVTAALPVAVERARPLRFQAWRPGEALEAGRYGIPVPLASAREVLPDVLFLPLAAYDRRGFRLGYGAGITTVRSRRCGGGKPSWRSASPFRSRRSRACRPNRTTSGSMR